MRLKLDLKTLSSNDEILVAGEKITFPREKGSIHEAGHPENFTEHAFKELIALAARYDLREEPRGRIFKNKAKRFQEKFLRLGGTQEQFNFYCQYDIGPMGRVDSSTAPEKSYRYKRHAEVVCEAMVFLIKQWDPSINRFKETTHYKGEMKPTFLVFKDFLEELIGTYNIKETGIRGKTSRLFALWKMVETRAHFYEGIHDGTTMLGSRLANAEARVQAAEAGMLQASQLNNRLNDERNILLRENQDLRAQVQCQAPIVENHLQVTGELQTNLAAQLSINRALMQEVEDQKQLASAVPEMRQQIRTLQQQLEFSQQTIKQSQEKLVSSKKKLDASKPNKQTKIIEALKAEVQQHVNTNEALAQENTQLKNENAQLKLDIAALVTTLRGFFNTITAWFKDLPQHFYEQKKAEKLDEKQTLGEALAADHTKVNQALSRYSFHNISQSSNSDAEAVKPSFK